MVNKIIDGISVKLNRTFGDGFRIYSSPVEQGFNEPCFFIMPLTPSQSPLIGNRFLRQHPFDIHYFPADKNDYGDMNEKGGDMYAALEYITLLDGSAVRGTAMKYEIVDGVLHFFVSFDMIVLLEDDPGEPMADLNAKTDVKG
ncbi:MAG: hypothetical protein Q8865_05510 [Bacillota bacterium]|nr:hypothetical protein [Bacillota bacterium]